MTSKWFIREICAIVHNSGKLGGYGKSLQVMNYEITVLPNRLWDRSALMIRDLTKRHRLHRSELDKLTKSQWKQLYSQIIIQKMKNKNGL